MKYILDIQARHFRDSSDFLDDCPLKRSIKEHFGLEATVGLSYLRIGENIFDIQCFVDDKQYNEFNLDMLNDILNKNEFVNKNIDGCIAKYKDLIKRKKRVGKINISLTKI